MAADFGIDSWVDQLFENNKIKGAENIFQGCNQEEMSDIIGQPTAHRKMPLRLACGVLLHGPVCVYVTISWLALRKYK